MAEEGVAGGHLAFSPRVHPKAVRVVVFGQSEIAFVPTRKELSKEPGHTAMLEII